MRTGQIEEDIQQQEQGKGSAWGTLRIACMVAGASLCVLAAANAAIAARIPPLQNGLRGTFNRFPSRHGDVAYVVAGAGSPVLLLHGIGAGNSMLEWEQNFDSLRAEHTVYALDLPGWGRSDRPADRYSSEEYIDLVRSFARNVIGTICAVIASSDSCTYAIEAAYQEPELFSGLVLVCPSTVPQQDETAILQGKAIFNILALPVIGQTLHNILTSRRAIRSFAERQLYFDRSRVDEKLIKRYYTDAHQPGARYGLASFVSGAMRPDAREAWSKLKQPALLVWGRNAMLNGLDTAPEWLALKTDARLEVVERSQLLPHVEHPDQWNQLVLDWLRDEGSSSTD